MHSISAANGRVWRLQVSVLDRNDFGLDKRVGERHRLICTMCKRHTNHVVLKSVTHDFSNDDVFGSDDFLIVQCLGCEHVSYCTHSMFSENIDTDTGEPLTTVDQFPKLSVEHLPIRLPYTTPSTVRRAYEETSIALSEGILTLAAAGTRLIVELICIDQKAQKYDLVDKIDELRDGGTISSSVADTIHGIRFFGNDAVHVGKVRPSELDAAWQTINTLISYIYGTLDSQDVLMTPERSVKLQRNRSKPKKS